MRSKPLVVYATRATTEILRNHLFNWAIWPDFSEIPSAEAPFLRYEEIALGQTVRLGARAIRPLPARHTVRRSATTSTAARRAWSSPATPGRTTRSGAR